MPASSAEPPGGSIRLQPLTRHRVAALSDDGWPEQVATLERAAGRGHVRLFRSDPPRRAMLQEDLDPDGFVADRAYDLGAALRDWSSTLLGPDGRTVVEGYCAILAERSNVDAQRIWEWGFLERVSTGLYLLDVVGAPDRVARPYLDSAERLVD